MIKEEVKLRVANGWDMSVMRSVMIFLVSNDGPREKHCHEKSGSAASQLVCQLCLTSILHQWKKTQIKTKTQIQEVNSVDRWLRYTSNQWRRCFQSVFSCSWVSLQNVKRADTIGWG